jgi:hypothetical protein
MNDVTSKPQAAEKPAATKVDEAQRADDIRANAVAAMEEVEAMQPTPTQEELNKIHRGEPGGYKTRQSKAS